MRLLTRLRESLRPPPIGSRKALSAFLEERSLFIAQKCAIDYCRGKTGLASYALFSEQQFLDALDVCRWESFEAVLSDLLVMVEALLRPHAGHEEREQLCEALIGVHSEILAACPVPAHRPQGWSDALAPFAARLRAASERPPLGPVDVAAHSARRLFDTLPIHASMRALDEEVVFGAVRFRMVALHQELRRRTAATDLVHALIG